MRPRNERHRQASWLFPEMVNAHSGRDIFSLAENTKILRGAGEIASDLGLRLVHETHRSRALFSGPSTTELMKQMPSLRLCADLSHWCCVHESYLAAPGQAENLWILNQSMRDLFLKSIS